jgi:lipoyl(octanoyl) transferase
MRAMTDARGPDTPDELWLLEHPPVYTQGLAGRPEHVLDPGDIPVVATDRGGQVTYHGPGQLVAYPLLDLERLGLGIRSLVCLLEGVVIDQLAELDVAAHRKEGAPGVFVDGAKIASIGLKVRRGCTFHGLAFNLDLDLTPFDRINPCGFAGQRMTRLSEVCGPSAVVAAPRRFTELLASALALDWTVAATHDDLNALEITSDETSPACNG